MKQFLISNAILVFMLSTSLAAQAEKPEPRIPVPEQVILELKDVSETIPDWLVRWELARLYHHSAQLEMSAEQYKTLLTEKPDLIEARIEYGCLLIWNKKTKQGLETLESVPLSELKLKTCAQVADAYISLNNLEKAEKVLRFYLSNSPDDQSIRLKLAELLSKEKKYNKAIEQYDEYLERDPENVQVRRKLGFVLNWAGNTERAAQELAKSLND